MMLDWIALAPTPDERLAWAQNHVHGRVVFAAALPRDRSLIGIHRAHALSIPPGVRHEDSLGVGALDQVVIAHEILFARDRLVVPQQIDGVHVAVIEMPAAVVEGLGDAVPERAGWRHLQAGPAPQRGQGRPEGGASPRARALHLPGL